MSLSDNKPVLQSFLLTPKDSLLGSSACSSGIVQSMICLEKKTLSLNNFLRHKFNHLTPLGDNTKQTSNENKKKLINLEISVKNYMARQHENCLMRS